MTSGTFTTEPMLMPQWHTNTPILGSLPEMSFSLGYSFLVTSFPLSLESRAATCPAAPLACATESGMSFGPENAPQTYIPGTDVSTGVRSSVSQNPNLLSLIPMAFAIAPADSGGIAPADSTTMSKTSSLMSAPSM